MTASGGGNLHVDYSENGILGASFRILTKQIIVLRYFICRWQAGLRACMRHLDPENEEVVQIRFHVSCPASVFRWPLYHSVVKA